MRRVRRELANTKLDEHYSRLAPQALQQMARDINEGYMPLWEEHDPRLPPLGRVMEAHVEPLPDGELALVGVLELFDRGDQIPFDPSRRMFMRSVTGPLQVTFDRSYQDDKSLALIKDIAAILGTTPQPEEKKALEPLSILVLAGSFVLGGIATGFFKEIGADAYKLLKDKLKLLFALRRAKKQPYVFRFVAYVNAEGRTIEADFLISRPETEALERLFHAHLAEADTFLMRYAREHPQVQRVVFDAGETSLRFSYAVRSDAVPFFGEGTGA